MQRRGEKVGFPRRTVRYKTITVGGHLPLSIYFNNEANTNIKTYRSHAKERYDGIGQPQRADMFTSVVVDVFYFDFYGWEVVGKVIAGFVAFVPVVVVAIFIVVVWGVHPNHPFFVFCDSVVVWLYGNLHLHLGIPEFVDMNGFPLECHAGGGPLEGKMIVEAHHFI